MVCVVGSEEFDTAGPSGQLWQSLPSGGAAGTDVPVKRIVDFSCMKKNLGECPYHTRLRAALISSCKDKDVKDVTLSTHLLKGGFVSDVHDVTLKLSTDEEDKRCVFKCEGMGNDPMARRLNLYEKEMLFYESVLPHLKCDLRVPRCISVVRGSDASTSGVLLEYVDHARIGIDLNSEDLVDITKSILDRLANMHAASSTEESRLPYRWPLASFGSLPKGGLRDVLSKGADSFSWPVFVREKWPEFEVRWGDKVVSVLKQSVDSYDDIEHRLHSGRQCLCHGDVKSANIFVEDASNEPVFIDWQYASLGKGVQDVAFFLVESFEVEFASRHAREFIDYYYDRLQHHCEALSLAPFYESREDLYEDVRLSLSYFPVFVAMWFGTMPIEKLIDPTFPERFVGRLTRLIQLFEI
jgi:tRNA A-37 threonylcarbamoyl transferase component Bud32